jgi:RNase P subunit RPR2
MKRFCFLIRINANRCSIDSTATAWKLPLLSKWQKQLYKEVAMTTVASFRNSEYETTCTKCGEPLIAPEWSEYVSEQSVLNLWHCTKCGCRFETEICVPADTEADAVVIKEFFPSLLVA